MRKYYEEMYPQTEIKNQKSERSSNLELYRIVCILMIVAHHYVVNSGLTSEGGPMQSNPFSSNSIYLWLLGAWGKTGINSFMMITGYFMCKSQISVRKFIKLLLQIYFYKLILFPILLFAGYESVTPLRIVKLLMPFWGLQSNFVGCFIVFYLTIPFWNILIQNLTKRQHQLLVALLLAVYTLLGSIPKFHISFNYVTWFGVIYIVASYIRLYPSKLFEKRSFWGWMTVLSVIIASISVLVVECVLGGENYRFVSDSNRIFAFAIAFCSFLWFKNLNIKYSGTINAFGAATFGVLLIHANSDAMRTWLWQDLIDCVGHYSLTLPHLVAYSMGCILAVFLVCNLIDQLRISSVEKWFFRYYDSEKAIKVDAWLTKIIS